MEKFIETYQKLSADNLEELTHIYTEDVLFVDPAHEIHGIVRLTEYFRNLFQNIDSIGFKFSHNLRQDSECYVQWQMTFTHPRLNRGKAITVPGTSYLHFADSGKVSLHRDYFDLGAMLYEQLPVLGKIIAYTKRRLGS